MKKKFISRTVVALLAAAMISASGSVAYADSDAEPYTTSESAVTETSSEPVVINVYDEYYDSDGNLVNREARQSDTIDKGSNYYYEALSVSDATATGDTVQQGVADSDKDITFTYLMTDDLVADEEKDADSEEDNTSSDITTTEEDDNTKSDVPKNAPKSTKNTSKETNAKAPKTGDNFNMGLGVACIGGGLAAVGAGLYLSKKKRA